MMRDMNTPISKTRSAKTWNDRSQHLSCIVSVNVMDRSVNEAGHCVVFDRSRVVERMCFQSLEGRKQAAEVLTRL